MESEPRGSPNSIIKKLKTSPLSITACFGKMHHHQGQGFTLPSPRDGTPKASPDACTRPKCTHNSQLISPRFSRTFSKSQDKCRSLIHRIGGSSGGGGKHFRRHSADFRYDAISYSLNFDRGWGDEDLEEFPMMSFSARLPATPPRSFMPEIKTSATNADEKFPVPNA